MNRALLPCAIVALLLTSCGALWFAAGAATVLVADYYYDDCDYHDDHDHYDDCDYYYGIWTPQTVVADDFDGDGRIDVAVGDGRDGSVWLVRGGDPARTPERRLVLRAAPGQMTLFRARGEEGAGLLALEASSGAVEAFAGDGSGGFLPLPGLAGAPPWTCVARGRLDGDEADDVAYVDGVGAVHVGLGRGDGTFEEKPGAVDAAVFLGPGVALRLAGVHVAVADFDGEPGDDLLVVDGRRARLAVFPGRGDGAFGPGSVASFESLGAAISVAPVILDPAGPAGLALLFEGAGGEGTLAVVRPGDGTFLVEGRPVGAARSLFACDLDGDGLSDLLLPVPSTGTVRILYARRG